MLGKMDKTDKKRTDFKGKKSAKKFKMAAKQKSGPGQPEQGANKAKHFEKGDDSNKTDSKMGAKIEKNKQMMKKKKEFKQTTKDGGQKSPMKEGEQPAEHGDRKAQWKKGGKPPIDGKGGKPDTDWKKGVKPASDWKKGGKPASDWKKGGKPSTDWKKGGKPGADGKRSGKPDHKKMWKKGGPVTEKKKKDDRPKLEEMSVKERKLVRQQANPNYELSNKAKKIWEKLRETNCTGAAREKLLEDLYKLIKGKAKELVRAHDTVRVLECCVQYGNEAQKTAVFEEVKDIILELCKSKYAKFFVLKVLKYGTRKQRDFVIQSFYGNVCKLVQHSIAAEVVEMAYNNWANAHHRSALLEEFYGAKYSVFKEAGVHTLEQILTKQPDSKQTIMEHMLKVLTPLLDKTVIKHTIVHKVLADFLTHAPMKMQVELIQLMREVVVQILHTHDGAKAAMHCFWFGTTKDRKHMIKSFKTFVARICKEEYGHRVLLTLFDVVDDTKLVSKVIIEEMMQSASELANDQYGRKVLLYLLSPRNPSHFHPSIVKQLEVGDNNPNSKKDTKVRREELLVAASPALLELVAEEAKEMATNKSLSQLMLAVLEHCKGDKTAAFQAVADLAAVEFVPSVTDSEDNIQQMHIVEHPSGHFLFRCLLMQEKALLEKQPDASGLFSDILLTTVSANNLRTWIGSNRSAFVLVNLANSPREQVKQQIKEVLQPVIKSLKLKSTKGCQTLLEKLTAQ